MTDSKDYSLGGADRDEWEQSWGAKTLRQIPGECHLDPSEYFRLLIVKTAALSEDPIEFADAIPVRSELCPVCGESTLGSARMAAHLTIEYERPREWEFKFGPHRWLGVWVHPACFERCTEMGISAGIPW